MSKFYYYPEKRENQDGRLINTTDSSQENDNSNGAMCISFMIFRTGSVLIVGKCDNESIIKEIYTFIKNILMKEYVDIMAESTAEQIESTNVPVKKKKVKKRKIIIYE